MKTVVSQVSGMSCASCAAKVNKTLEKQGATNITVNFATGDVRFDIVDEDKQSVDQILKKIEDLGYTVVDTTVPESKVPVYRSLLFKFIFSAVLTFPLLLHMFVKDPWLSSPWVQWALSTPVFIVGVVTFGKPAWRSLLNRMPDMNVLVLLGASAAYIYSLFGMFLFTEHVHHYLFFETSASIITLILLGNYIEERAVKKTSSSIEGLVRLQKTMTKKLEKDALGIERIVSVENYLLKVGDKVLVNSGDQIPMDGKITWGEARINEAMVSGESKPLLKSVNSEVIGGTLLEEGTIKLTVTAVGRDTVLSHIIELVKQAQNEKPVMQKLVDRISAIFVPVVLIISLVTLVAWIWLTDETFAQSMMHSIAVMVIACPCAMGLATPLALMVGLGRSARNGILIKGSRTLESFKNIRQIAFDKTGTLTTGKLAIQQYQFFDVEEKEFKSLVVSMEQHSSHPIAKTLVALWPAELQNFQSVEELKGKGISATTASGDRYFAGAYHALATEPKDKTHSVYVEKNGRLIGWIDLQEEIRPQVKEVIACLKKQNIEPILLSGDSRYKCEQIAHEVGITEIYSEQSPEQKMKQLALLLEKAPTAMMGDGINDAPALAKATIGIALSDATQIAMQNADVVILNGNFGNLPLALGLGKHTFLTIKENLFWAFIYNIVAIPLAAFGLLTPILAAASMALSDVFLLANSVRLQYKKIR